jgi:hypothetical protein
MSEGTIGRGTCIVACAFALLIGGIGGFYFGSGRDGAGEESMRSADGDGHDVASATNETSPANQRVRRTDDPPPSNPKKDPDHDVSDDDKIWMRDALKKEKARREAAEFRDDDTGRKVLERIQTYGADPTPLFSNFERFSKPLRVRPDPAKVVHLTPENANQILDELSRGEIEPTTFLLSAGTFALRSNFRLRNADHVVIRGEGMDRTIVKCEQSFVFAEDVQQVTVENLAIDTVERGDELLDSRGPASFLFSRVRTYGFDCGAGGSSAIYFSAPIYVGVDQCEILGGYGRDPMGGFAAAVRGLGYVYFQNCLFKELSAPAVEDGDDIDGSRVVFEGCRFSFLDDFARSEKSWVAFRGCTFDNVVRAEGNRVPPRLDLGGNTVTLADRNADPSAILKIQAIESAGDVLLGMKIAGRGKFYVDVHCVGNPPTTLRWFLPPGSPPERRPGADIELPTAEGSTAPSIRLSTAAAAALAALTTGGSTPTIRSVMIVRGSTGRMWRIDTSHGTKFVDSESGEVRE